MAKRTRKARGISIAAPRLVSGLQRNRNLQCVQHFETRGGHVNLQALAVLLAQYVLRDVHRKALDTESSEMGSDLARLLKVFPGLSRGRRRHRVPPSRPPAPEVFRQDAPTAHEFGKRHAELDGTDRLSIRQPADMGVPYPPREIDPFRRRERVPSAKVRESLGTQILAKVGDGSSDGLQPVLRQKLIVIPGAGDVEFSFEELPSLGI